MSDKSDDPPSPGGQGGADRKITKPLMEKRRRARINSCLTELKALLLTNADEKESGRFAKLEKADILELTVKFLRNRQHSAVSGNHTALYRAGFNKCMEELSTFLNADDENSVNLRLKLTTHLTEILCSMDRLKDASSKGQAERSNMSPVFQVSSSSDDLGCLNSSLTQGSLPAGTSTETQGIKSPAKCSTETPDTDRFKLCQASTGVPPSVNTGGSFVQTALSQAESPAPSVPAYTTIPLVPTVVTPGQVLLLVPNNNNGKLGLQLPAFTSGAFGHLYQPRDCQPMVLTEATRPNSFNYTTVPTSDLPVNSSGLNLSMSAAHKQFIKAEPHLTPSTCAVQPTKDSVIPTSDPIPLPLFKPVTVETSDPVEFPPEKCKPSPKNFDDECKLRNDGVSGSGPDTHGPMWRPW